MHTRTVYRQSFQKNASLMTRSIYNGAVARSAAAMAMPIHQLFPPEGTDKELFNFDVVFFHGLQISGGNTAWERTWISPRAGPNGEDVCWPREWLPQDFDKIRVLSASFDSDATKLFGRGNNESTEDIGEVLIKCMPEYEYFLHHELCRNKFSLVLESICCV